MSTFAAERILIVERPDGRDMLKLALEHAGFEVDLADDAERALEMAEERRPAVIIADIALPRMNGWELAKRLRRRYGGELRLVALTSLGEPDDLARSAEAGFDQHLVKPVQPTILQAAIRQLLAA
jgi:CheY-like chemotaxis protein